MAKTGIRDVAKTISPVWFKDGIAEKLVYGIGLLSDALLEKLQEGVRARIPTYGTTTATPMIGADRGIGQGLGEPGDRYAARLRLAFDDWAFAGSARAVLRQSLAFIYAPPTRARMVTQNSVWDTYIDTDNSATTAPSHFLAASNWQWDTLNVLQPIQGWWRSWLIFYATTFAGSPVFTVTGATNASPIVITTRQPHLLSTGSTVVVAGVGGNTAANASWSVTALSPTTLGLNHSSQLGVGVAGAYTSGGTVTPVWAVPAPTIGTAGVTFGGDPSMSIGFANPPETFSSLRTIAAQWKGAHCWIPWIIVSFDSTLFDPTKPFGDATLPDGNWGTWAKTVTGVSVAARNASARYVNGVTLCQASTKEARFRQRS